MNKLFADGENYLYNNIPHYMHAPIIEYIKYGKPVGDFLRAVICNNLKEAYLYADENNVQCIREYVMFFFNHAPSGCWGSPENYTNYIEHFRNMNKEIS